MKEVILQTVGLEKSYGKRTVLQDFSFSLQEGEILGVAGKNGAGKSTLLSLLATIQKPQSGRILFYGEDIRVAKRKYRASIGYVPQEIALFEELSGKDNLKFFGSACKVPKKELAERIREACAITNFPEEELNKPVSVYSGGMRRKINIGAAILHRPKLLLLDEPVANLDEAAEEQVLKALRELADQGTAIVYVGHRIKQMEQFCNSICFIKDNKQL